MAGSNLPEVSAFPANVTGPDASDLVTAASVRVMGISLADRTQNLNASKANLAGATFTGVVTGPVGDLTWPVSPADRSFSAQVNNGATVSASDSFVMKKAVTLTAQLVANGGTGYTAPTIWTTPSVPWILEGACIQIAGTCTSDADPSNVTLTLYIGTVTVVVGTSSLFAAGTTYTVDGTTTNKTIFGFTAAEKGTLLTQPYASSGTDDIGFALDTTDLSVAVLANGGATGMWGKDVTMTVVHGSVTARTLTMPCEVILWGRML